MEKNFFYLIVLSISLFAINTNAQPSYIYNGGGGNGFASETLNPTNFDLFKGSKEDGGYSTIFYGANMMLYKGGENDGYASIFAKPDFIWTGAIGTGWSVNGNWNNNAVPLVDSKVIIPDNVPNYPFINAGLFAIGENPNNGAYKCQELWIQENALLVTRVNCRVENYGSIIIDGELRVRKITADAFINKPGSNVLVSPTGLFTFN